MSPSFSRGVAISLIIVAVFWFIAIDGCIMLAIMGSHQETQVIIESCPLA
ncbi:MAG: hypothetical protein ACXV6K_09310 [Halobacteriota archaeon]